MMKQAKTILAGAMLLLVGVLSSCKSEAPYKTDDVTIKLEVKTLSAGFCEVQMGTYDVKGKRVKDAYYYADVVPVEKDVDLDKSYKNVANILLDSVYMEYIAWRHDVLMTLTPFIADFASHSLYYDQTEEVFTFLDPDTDYWLMAFVVDPETNKPVGKIFWQVIHTKEKSEIAVNFDVRVSGNWTYYYPNDAETGMTMNNFPYLACMMDSVVMRERLKNEPDQCPATFLLDSMQRVAASYDYKNTPVLYGITVNNIGLSKDIAFIEGHTYYVGLAGFDGNFSQNHRNLVKFQWKGDSTQVMMHQEDGIGFNW